MRFLIKVLLVLAAAVAVVTLVGEGPGYVLVQVGEYTLETTAALAGIALVLALAVGWELWALLSRAWELPTRLAEWRRQHRLERSLELLEEGLLALEGGEGERAQRLLDRGARQTEESRIFYLEAARAAHLAGDRDEAEAYLDKAQRNGHSEDTAANLLRAEIELDAGRGEHALALLSDLEHRQKDNPEVLRRLLDLYRRVEDWDALLRLLPRASKAEAVTREAAAEELITVRGRRMEEARLAGESPTVEELWRQADRSERLDSRLVAPWVRYLLSRGRGKEAEKVLDHALKRSWQGELVDLYLVLPEAPGSAQDMLQRLEGWLQSHPDDPHLLTVLAQLALAAQLWGKADHYLGELSGRSDLAPEILLRLAQLYQEREQPEEALSYCRRGLAALEGTELLALPGSLAASRTDQRLE